MRRILLFVFVLALALPAAALGATAGTVDPHPAPTLWLPTDQLWAWVASAFALFPAYYFNHHGPQIDETIKGIVIGLFAAVAAGITQALTAGDVGFNATTAQFIVSSVFAAFMAHKFVWQTTGIAQKLGAGTNAQAGPPAG